MKFTPMIATGRASCKLCDGVIPKGQPCLELVYGAGGAHTQRNKVCLPCLTDITGEVRNLGDYTEPVFSENYPVTFEDKGLRDFIQENFEEQIGGITLTDEELDQFKRHLEASLSDWICDNWRDFTENRGD